MDDSKPTPVTTRSHEDVMRSWIHDQATYAASRFPLSERRAVHDAIVRVATDAADTARAAAQNECSAIAKRVAYEAWSKREESREDDIVHGFQSDMEAADEIGTRIRALSPLLDATPTKADGTR